jgi:hypothetical protein
LAAQNGDTSNVPAFLGAIRAGHFRALVALKVWGRGSHDGTSASVSSTAAAAAADDGLLLVSSLI